MPGTGGSADWYEERGSSEEVLMKYLRLLLAVALVSLVVSACSSPTVPNPSPEDDGSQPPDQPNPGFVVRG